MITSQTVKPSQVLLPNVYRYLDKKFVDLFFEDGIIRLGSFSRFQKYPDEVRGDISEGKGAIQSKSKEGYPSCWCYRSWNRWLHTLYKHLGKCRVDEGIQDR